MIECLGEKRLRVSVQLRKSNFPNCHILEKLLPILQRRGQMNILHILNRRLQMKILHYSTKVNLYRQLVANAPGQLEKKEDTKRNTVDVAKWRNISHLVDNQM